MKNKVSFLLMIVLALGIFISCSPKENVQSYFTLIEDGATQTTLLAKDRINNEDKVYEVSYPEEFTKVERNSELTYNFTEEEIRVNLKIEKIKFGNVGEVYVENSSQIILNEDLGNEKVTTNLQPGKYVYIFTVDWKDRTTEYIKFIEII